MLRNYLKTAFRTLRRHPGYTAINLIGLSVGMGCCLLMLLFVRHEYRINKEFAKGDTLYRVNSVWHEQGDAVRLVSFAPLAEAMRSDFAGVANAVRYTAIDVDLLVDNQPFRTSTLIAGPELFSMFDFAFIAGNPAAALDQPDTAVLMEEEALRLFGSTDVVGRTFQMMTWAGGGKKEYRITGVLRQPAYNSVTYIGQDAHPMILPFANTGDFFGDAGFDDDWSIYNTVTFAELADGADPSRVEEQLEPLLEQRLPAELKGTVSLTLEPLEDVYLNEFDGAARRLANLLLLLALLILGIACFNFVNVSTALAVSRAREVGMRKVLGASNRQLVVQYIGEALILCFLGMIAALVLARGALPSFNGLVERSLELRVGEPDLVILLLGVVLLTGVVSGAYPAFYLAAVQPVRALKNLSRKGRLATGLRRVLVVAQFAAAISLFIVAIAVTRQADFIANQNTGFEKEQVLVVSSLPREWTPDGVQRVDVIKQRVLTLSGVDRASMAWGPPGPRYTGITGEFLASGAAQPLSIPVSQVDPDFLETLDLNLADGRFFDSVAPSSGPTIVLNERAVRAFGWSRPIGQQITWDGVEYTVIGVVKDYNTVGLEHPIGPVALLDVRQSPLYRELLVRFSAEASDRIIDDLQAAWAAIYPETVFDYYFLDDQWRDLHRWIWRTRQIAGAATGLAIFIACLGLLGLVSINVSKRTREIGIRKVLGASAARLVHMLLNEFMTLVGVAFLLAVPVSLIVVQRWLDGFARSITLGPDLFAGAGLVVAVLATLVVGTQSLRAAYANPVEALREE